MKPTDRKQILAFRLAAHNLGRRLGARSLTRAAAACGIQETPIASAAPAFLARVENLTPALLHRALAEDRNLVALWSMRGAPHVVSAEDLGVFTVGALPLDVASFKYSLGGWADALEEAGLDPFVILEHMISAAKKLLDGRTMNVNDLRDEIFAQVRPLRKVKRPSFSRADMPEPLFRALGTSGAVCIVSGRGTDAELARIDQWVRTPIMTHNRDLSRSELARRFLRCFGPATAQNFADWTKRSLSDAKNAFSLIEEELLAIAADGGKAWLLRSDQKRFSSPPEPKEVRLLPVQDPYLQQRDRSTVLPDATLRRKLWQPTRGPGGLLVDGEVVGTWRARSKRDRLELTVEPFGRLPRGAREHIEAEAARIAPFRGCETAEVSFTR
jgi:hypothetical protein